MTASTLVVPDASVLLKWVLPPANEPDAHQALRLRDAIAEDEVRAVVPSLWLYETGNTVARRFPAHAEAWMAAMMKFGLEEAQPDASWLSQVLDLTRSYDVSFYDAAYHALALVRGGLFVTADRRYAKRAGEAGAVMFIGDWKN